MKLSVICLWPRITVLIGFASVYFHWNVSILTENTASAVSHKDDVMNTLRDKNFKINKKDRKTGNIFPLLEGFRSNFKTKGESGGNFLLPPPSSPEHNLFSLYFANRNLSALTSSWPQSEIYSFLKGLWRRVGLDEENNTYLISWRQACICRGLCHSKKSLSFFILTMMCHLNLKCMRFALMCCCISFWYQQNQSS